MKIFDSKLLILIFALFSSSRVWAEEATGFAATLSSFSVGVDSFFNTYFGWFVNAVFFSVPMGGTKFPLIVERVKFLTSKH